MVAYCHCSDCKRVTGAPVAAFAAFSDQDLEITPDQTGMVSVTDGVRRWFCKGCGSPLAARFDYLPGQVYVPLGLLDQAIDLPPKIHCHAEHSLQWLEMNDGMERVTGSARNALDVGDKCPTPIS